MNATSSERKPLSLTRKTVYASLTLALSLVAAEFLLRALDAPQFDACEARPREEFAMPDPELGWTLKPGADVARERMNAWGLRGPVPEQPKPEGRTRILFVGDSTCWGLQVSLEDCFAHRATTRLNAATKDGAFDFCIGAAPGYSSYQSKVLLERLLPKVAPDWVVFYVGAHNDHSRSKYYPDRDIPARWARRSTGWHGVRLLRLLEAGVDYSYHKWGRKLRDERARARVPPDDFRANVKTMLRLCAAARVKALVLLPPYSSSLLERHETIPDYQVALAAVAKEFNVPAVALQPALEPIDEKRLYPIDDFHLSPLGHRIVGDVIVKAILAD